MANPSLQIGNSNWAIKEDNLLGYSTAGTRFVPQPITMTRASAGTRVNSSGLVETVELLGSEEITGFTNGTSYPFSTFTTSGNNITSAIISSSFAGAVSNSISIVNGKTYKVTFTYTKNSGDDLRVLISNSISGAGTSISNIEQVSASGDITLFFTATSTTTGYLQMGTGNSGHSLNVSITNVSVKESTKNNLARVDYDGTASSLLAEPMRTNFVVTSASGTYGSSPASEILAIAPDGENTAIRPVPSTSSNRYQETIAGGTYSSGDEVTYSWYRKRFSTPVVDSYVGDLYINLLVNCTQVGVATEIISDVNGFNRVSATFSITDGSIDSILRFYFGSIIGDGNSSVAYWGHQLEVGSYATSYIPTDGGTVTRVQDQYSKTGISNLINSEEGVLFVEMAALADDGVAKYLTMNDGSSNNDVRIYFNTASNGISALLKSTTGATQAFLSYTVTDTTAFHKIAFVYAVNRFELWVDGEKRAEDLSGIAPVGLTTLEFSRASNFLPLFAKVKQLQIFKTTDIDLAALTS